MVLNINYTEDLLATHEQTPMYHVATVDIGAKSILTDQVIIDILTSKGIYSGEFYCTESWFPELPDICWHEVSIYSTNKNHWIYKR